MVSKILQLFSSAQPIPGIEKINGFIQYLKGKQAISQVINLRKKPVLPAAAYNHALTVIEKFPRKWIPADYDTVFQSGNYFMIPNTGEHHTLLAAHLDRLGVQYFEGQLKGGTGERKEASGEQRGETGEQKGGPDELRKNSEKNDMIIGGKDVNFHVQGIPPVKVAALMHVFNEGDILEETIRHLLAQGVHVHLIDNWSTDGSWEIAERFSPDQVTRERFPAEGPTGHYEWHKQLEYSGVLASRLSYDWFIHYDADEFRYSPWKGASLHDAIAFIDQAGYNAIDFTVLDFRYTPDAEQVRADFEKHNRWFEFGKRPGHFLQVKSWKKQAAPVNLHDSGGHDIQFPGRKVYPIKFLIKHYSLRSKEQAVKKLVEQRLPRVQKELSERNWHSHIQLLIEQQTKGWNKQELIEWDDATFDQHFLLERISGVGII